MVIGRFANLNDLARALSSRSLVLVASSAMALVGCASFSPRVDLQEPARELGIVAAGNDCPSSSGEVTSRQEAEWRTRAEPAPSATLPRPTRNAYACLSLRDSLSRDSMSECTPDVTSVFATRLEVPRRVRGEMAYVGVDPREYGYDLAPLSNGDLLVEVRIAFTGALAKRPEVSASMSRKLTDAAEIWTRSSVVFGERKNRMRFRFVAVPETEDSHFVIHLVPGEPRTPFDETWGEGWSAHLMAHEIGHMMGLDDEYEQFRKTLGHALGREAAWRADPTIRLSWLRCDLGSLMCDSKGESAVPLPHHYYLIARRRFCRSQSPGFYGPFDPR